MDKNRGRPFLDACKTVTTMALLSFILWLIMELIITIVHGIHITIDMTVLGMVGELLLDILVIVIYIGGAIFYIMAIIGAVYWLWEQFERWNKKG